MVYLFSRKEHSTTSELVKRHILCIQALNRYKSADLLCALAECAYNILKKNIPLTEVQRRRLNKYRTKLRELSQRRAPAARRRRMLLQPQFGEGQIGLPSTVGKLGLFPLLREVLLKK